MLGFWFCRLWAHRWHYMFTNPRGKAVLHCSRCFKVKADKS